MFGKRRTYLDYAAGVAGNPSSSHEEGRLAKIMLEAARTDIARLVEVQPDDVVFTSGATEANALAMLGHVRALMAHEGRKVHLLYLPSAHASIVENANLLSDAGVDVEPLPIKDYRVDIEALKKIIRPETALVSMDAVCGETGVVWNTREVAETLRKAISGETIFPLARGTAATREKIRFPAARVLLHVDASQAPHTEKLTRAHFNADILVLDASKVCATRGIGVLIAHRTIPMAPLYKGGGQERGLRSGTETPELAREFAAALRAAALGRETFRASSLAARAQLIESIKNAIPNVVIQEGHAQASHILNLSFPGRDTDYLVALLDEAGFAVSTRSACETDSEAGSRAVFALTGDAERARATLRIAWGPRISPRSLTRFVKVLAEAVAFIDNAGGR